MKFVELLFSLSNWYSKLTVLPSWFEAATYRAISEGNIFMQAILFIGGFVYVFWPIFAFLFTLLAVVYILNIIFVRPTQEA